MVVPMMTTTATAAAKEVCRSHHEEDEFLLTTKDDDVEATSPTTTSSVTSTSSSSSSSCLVEAATGDQQQQQMALGKSDGAKNVDDNDDEDEEEEETVEETLALLQILSYFCLESFSRLSFYLPVFMQFVWGIAVYILRSLVLTYAVKLFLCQRKNNKSNNNKKSIKNGSSSRNNHDDSNSSHHHPPLTSPAIKHSSSDVSDKSSSRSNSNSFSNTLSHWVTSAIVPLFMLLPQWMTESTACRSVFVVLAGEEAMADICGGANAISGGAAAFLLTSSSTSKAAAAAWPPPALICLALLTVFALVVHPDGMTWILLRKLRDGMISLFRSSTTCWAWVVNDYGAILSTIFALATFAGLFFFCYLLQRTLARPRKQPLVSKHHHSQSHLDKTKRRKKKGLRGGGRGGRTRAQQQHQSKGHATTTHSSEHLSLSAATEAEEHDRTTATSPTNRTILPAVLEDKPVEESVANDGNRDCASPAHEKPDNNGDSSSGNVSAPATAIETSASTELPRLRVESVSSVDTSTTMSMCFACLSENYQLACTCGSGSSMHGGRSTPVSAMEKSTGSTTTRVVSPSTSSSSPSVQTGNSKKLNSNPHPSSSRKQSSRRGGKKHANALDGKQNTPSSPVTPSRWDALKPTLTTTRRSHHNNNSNISHTGGKGRHQFDSTPNRPVRHNSNAGARSTSQQHRGDSPSFPTVHKLEESLPTATASQRSIADATADLQRVLPSTSVSFDSASDVGLLMRASAGSKFGANVPEDGPSLVSGLPLTSFPATSNDSATESSTFFSTPTKSKSATGFFNNTLTTPPRNSLVGTPFNNSSSMDGASDTTPKAATTLRAPPGLTPVAPPGLPPPESHHSLSPSSYQPPMATSSLADTLVGKTPASTPTHPSSSSSMFSEPQSSNAAPVYDLFSGAADDSSDYTPQYRPGNNGGGAAALGDLLPPPSLACGGGGGVDSHGNNPTFLDSTTTTTTTTSAACGGGGSSSSPLFRPVSMVKENPFELDSAGAGGSSGSGSGARSSMDEDQQIEAELKELGGQMVGSILDF